MASSYARLFVMLLACCTACAPGTAVVPALTFPPAAAVSATVPAEATRPAEGTASLSSPTPTPLPAPRHFTETFDGPALHWTFQQAGSSQALTAPAIRDGFLVFDLTAPNLWAYAFYGGPDYGDVTVEARVQSRTNGDGAAGVICRYDRNAGWYELNVFADGTYQMLFGRWLAEGVASYVPLYRAQAEAIQTDENSIALQCRGDTLTPFLNGQQQRQWKELKFGLRKGQIGLTVSSFADGPFMAAFDSVKVSEP